MRWLKINILFLFWLEWLLVFLKNVPLLCAEITHSNVCIYIYYINLIKIFNYETNRHSRFLYIIWEWGLYFLFRFFHLIKTDFLIKLKSYIDSLFCLIHVLNTIVFILSASILLKSSKFINVCFYMANQV